jgi:hypothetical protein
MTNKIMYKQCGDPNGTRTRVFAVKGDKPLVSTARPAFPVSFPPLFINGLRGRGDAQGIEAATAGETVKQGSTEGESPVAKPCAQRRPHD